MAEAPPTGNPTDGIVDTSRPLGIYVHVPFCTVRCPYCDFAVDTRAPIPHDAFANAVIGELRARAAAFAAGAGPAPVSIYFGGGTPALLRPEALVRILDAARAVLGNPPSEALEITVEANPGEVDRAALKALRAGGVRRLSLGAQSFVDAELRALGRTHDAAAIAPALQAAREAGFADVACDLMYGVPGQTLDSWRRSVDALLGLGPDHISAYALTIERGTTFGARQRAGRLPRIEDDLVALMFEQARDAFEAGGFEHYEVSSYARPGRRSRHNQLYWSGGATLAAGPGATSFRPLADGGAWRFTNPRALGTYLRDADRGGGAPAPARVEHRTHADLDDEALWLGLRTSDGVDRAVHTARFQRDPLAGREDAVARCVAAGWLRVDAARMRLTRRGFLLADEVAARLWRGPQANEGVRRGS